MKRFLLLTMLVAIFSTQAHAQVGLAAKFLEFTELIIKTSPKFLDDAAKALASQIDDTAIKLFETESFSAFTAEVSRILQKSSETIGPKYFASRGFRGIDMEHFVRMEAILGGTSFRSFFESKILAFCELAPATEIERLGVVLAQNHEFEIAQKMVPAIWNRTKGYSLELMTRSEAGGAILNIYRSIFRRAVESAKMLPKNGIYHPEDEVFGVYKVLSHMSINNISSESLRKALAAEFDDFIKVLLKEGKITEKTAARILEKFMTY